MENVCDKFMDSILLHQAVILFYEEIGIEYQISHLINYSIRIGELRSYIRTVLILNIVTFN